MGERTHRAGTTVSQYIDTGTDPSQQSGRKCRRDVNNVYEPSVSDSSTHQRVKREKASHIQALLLSLGKKGEVFSQKKSLHLLSSGTGVDNLSAASCL